MEAGSSVIARIDQLFALFNARSMDVPDGLFDRRAQFLLNGVAFEEMLGQPPSDPLVLMLSRGAAGYRFTVKALQHAVPDARVARGELSEGSRDGASTFSGECWLSGHLRGTGEPAEIVWGLELTVGRAGGIERAGVTVDESALARIREARLRP
jgi:hypothetical protein